MLCAFLWCTRYNLEYVKQNIPIREFIIRQFQFIIPSWRKYFKFIVFTLISHIFPRVVNRQVLVSNVII